jgi:hypothetical protein
MTYALLWLVVTAAAVFVAAAAVGSVRDQVTDAPTAMAPTTTAATTTTTTVPPRIDTDTPRAGTSPTTTAASPLTTLTTTTTTTAPAVTTTRPTAPPSTTTSTTATAATSPAVEIRTYDLVGGSVTVEIGSSEVHLAGASPKAGFRMEVEDNGPDKVQVEFKSERHESHFSGRSEDGRFIPEIEESAHDDDGEGEGDD